MDQHQNTERNNGTLSEHEEEEIENDTAMSDMICGASIREGSTLEDITIKDEKLRPKLRNDPVIDEDGFELVQSRRRR